MKNNQIKEKKITSVLEMHKTNIEITGKNSIHYKKMVKNYTLASVFLGIGYFLMFPILSNLFSHNWTYFSVWTGLLVVFYLVYAYGTFHAHDYDYTGVLYDVMYDLRVNLGEKLRNMPLKKLYSFRTGDLNSLFSANVEDAMMSVGMVAGMYLEIVILAALTIVGVFFIDYRLGFLLLVIFPLSYPIYLRSRSVNEKGKVALNKANAKLESESIEYIQGLAVLKSLNKVGKNAEKFQQAVSEAHYVQKKTMWQGLFFLSLVNSFLEFAMIFVLMLGVYLVSHSTLTPVNIVALMFVILRISEPLANLLAVMNMIDLAAIAFARIKELLATKELDILEPIEKPSQFDIEFSDVDFFYDREQVLSDISFTLPEKSLTAIVGPSGSGKTTITRLITRYDDPSKGFIKIGGVDIRHMKAQDLMHNISIVFQDVYLFDDTILENIRMGKPNATDEECLAAAKMANCDDFIIHLEDGYQTQVGEIGGSLSGGERQRISIARAILKDTPIVILDEPTSALDTGSEVAVQNALNTLVKDKTLIVIAHRLSTITGADKIMVLENGKITQIGSHKEILAQEGRYKKMQEAGARVKNWQL